MAVLAALIYLSGVSHAAETPRAALSADFETANAPSIAAPESTATLTEDPREVVSGARSLKGDSRGSAMEWNEFLHLRAGVFDAGEAYKISFDYKVLARDGDAEFYTLLRRASGGGDAGWKDWKGAPGDKGHVETEFLTHNAPDYTLIIGIQHKGAIAIDNLVIQTDPANRPRDIRLPFPARVWTSPGHTAYYLDSQHGDDAADGKSAARAWRSLDKVNAGTFAPGDQILLRAGGRWSGFLAPGGKGAAGAPIVIDQYGKGPKPRIDAQGLTLATLFLHNTEYIEARHLDLANKGPVPQPKLAGVEVEIDDFGDAHQIALIGLDIHDVTGSNVKSDGGGNGIHVACSGAKTPSRYDGLRIEGCRLTRTDRNGITMDGNWSRDHWLPSLHVVIRNNVLEDIGGDGIVPIACDKALVERNIIRGGRMRCDDYAAGIWPWSCDNTTIQYNEVSGMHGTKDGEGYDCDYNCQNTLFQYNYSHDNDGGFMLICNDGGQKLPWNIGNLGSTIRYNISVNDGLHTFNISGPCQNTQIYNNTISIGKGQDIKIVDSGNWGGAWSDNTRFTNNIFFVAGKADFAFAGMTNTLFTHNAFWGVLPNRPADSHAILTDPQFKAPGSAKPGLGSLAGYQLRPGSPCIGAGAPVKDNGGRDFWGRVTPPGAVNVGAG